LHLAESFLAIGDVDQTRWHLNAAFAHLRTWGGIFGFGTLPCEAKAAEG
jgi:hypothetical protein